MYLIPVTQFLNDVPTSDVSKSVTSFHPLGHPNLYKEIKYKLTNLKDTL